MIPARSTDPATSHIAAAEIRDDGTAATMEALAYRMILLHPGFTSNELEAVAEVGHDQLRKRIWSLEKRCLVRRGGVRRSNISGKLNHTWWPSVPSSDKTTQKELF